jgi:hypothetical protein
MKTISASPKKSYQKPTLRVYGDIKELTMAFGGMGPVDGGSGGGMIKTG